MVLGDVEESITTREIDEETEEEIVRVGANQILLLLLPPFNSQVMFVDIKADH